MTGSGSVSMRVARPNWEVASSCSANLSFSLIKQEDFWSCQSYIRSKLKDEVQEQIMMTLKMSWRGRVEWMVNEIAAPLEGDHRIPIDFNGHRLSPSISQLAVRASEPWKEPNSVVIHWPHLTCGSCPAMCVAFRSGTISGDGLKLAKYLKGNYREEGDNLCGHRGQD